MKVVYLDQNKWIELARVQAGITTSGPLVELYSRVEAAVKQELIVFPLSVSHVIETSKRNDAKSRGCVALVQAKLSRGIAYRSRAGRLHVEVCNVMHRVFKGLTPNQTQNWFLVNCFFEAFEPFDSMVSQSEDVDAIKRMLMRKAAPDLYFDFMVGQDDSIRRYANSKFNSGISDLISRIESRRKKLDGLTVDVRRRVYLVQLFLENQDLFLHIANQLGYSYGDLRRMGDLAVRSLVEDVPTLNVEAEMSARLESETVKLKTNDAIDMQSFYTAIPYSSWIFAEKASISRARQAKLDSKYGVAMSSSIIDLFKVIP
ncbi:hypothetical protein I5L56_02500 [Pseudomonas oryzihabitans]|uniref:hypothetical protein n=1 Tax=Pseudomonas oryzihabitans TaxID=47885 RepID=UPI0018D66DC4|nr:hypothetical protein [Pseudomonas oryzihabitans]MBH3328474.1 hypothetical protein [Pseudomonas oryzihabitans]